MNIRPPISSSQTIYYAQSLPLANVVKPRILLQKQTIPILTSFPRSQSHYNSPVVYKQQNQENLLKLSNSNKEIYYSPPPVYSEQKTNKIETRQRNLSPEAVTVLDILSKIKSTNTFQINKQKIQIKAPVNIQNEPPPKENIPPKQIIEPYNEVKTSTFKRSCNCSPKSSPKNRNLPDISFPVKTDESDQNSDVKVYKINLKATSNPLEVTTINPRNESPKRGESSPKKFGVSPKQSILLKNDSKDFSKNEAHPKLFEMNYNSNIDSFALNGKNSKSDIFQPTIAAKNSNIIREGGNESIEHRSQILNSNKIPSATYIANNQIKDPQNPFGKINNNPQIDAQTEENGKDKGPIQNLLGKINECLSKTSNILNKTYEETKNELLPQPKSVNSKENNKSDIGGEDLLKITTSPVKEVQLELSDAMTIQSQFNDTLKSFNANPTKDNFFSQSNNQKEMSSLPKKNDHEIIEIDKILENTAAIFQAADSLNPENLQGKPTNNEILNSPQRPLRDNFSPIIERSERDEDKENNSPFINVYTGKSPKNLKEQAEEILRVSNQENRVPTSPPNKNSNNVPVETPYNKEAVGLIMQSPSEATEKPVQRVIQASVNTSNFIKNKKDMLNNKISPKTDGKRKIKSEKKITSVSEMYHNSETKNLKEKSHSDKNIKAEKITAGSEKRATQEINLNKPNTIKVDSNNEKGSYAKIAQKYQKNTKEPSIKQNKILNEITTIDQEIENLEKDAQKDKIDQKMLKFYDNYKAYKHKLPSIQENDESMKRKTLSQTPLSSSKTFDKKKPYTKQEEGKIVKKEQKINDVNNKIVQERCNYLYAKAIEVSQKKQKEIEENQKKKEIAEKNICTFKPEFISKKNNENILQNKDKVGKPSLKSLENRDNPRGLKRTASQNLTKVSKNARDTVKMNKSMSPPKNSTNHSKNHSKKQQQFANNSAKPWISPRSTASSKTRRMSKENMLKTSNGHLIGSPNPTNNILRKAESNFVDPHLNGEIFDILKIFSGINEVLVTQKEAKMAEIQGKEQGKYTFEKLRDLSPIKPTHNLENSQNNKSFNENSINDNSARNNHETRTSFEKVLGLLDQKHQDLLLKSVEMTKKVEKIFKENSVYVV